MLWIDKKYALMLPLQGATQKGSGDHFLNFRCEVCGDSQKNSSKKRGWFIANGNDLHYHCYNCDYHTVFSYYLKSRFPEFYTDYVREKFENKQTFFDDEDPFDAFGSNVNNMSLIDVSQLPKDHMATKYLLNRGISVDKLDRFYYTDNYYAWCKEQLPDEFNKDIDQDRRVIIPFKTRDGRIFTTIGRTLDGKIPKYLTARFDKNQPKVFGMDTVNINKKVYVVEGPFDSLFLDNSIAVAGLLGNMETVRKKLGIAKENIVIIPDNEKRNAQTKKIVAKNIELGYNVFIWPKNLKSKDINDLINTGLETKLIMKLINENIHSGLKAKLMMS